MSGWGLIVRADDTVGIVPMVKGSTYRTLSDAVEGYIECVALSFGSTSIDMWVNEEGLLIGLRLNKFATQCHAMAVGVENACIVGNVIFTGGSDEEGETNPLTTEELKFLIELMASKFVEDFDGPHFSWKGAKWSDTRP